MQQIRNAIPNLLTLGNLACGLVAIVLLMDQSASLTNPYATIGWLMVGAFAFDFADGFAARALKATSPVGKELDSLSDLVSFGVLPGLMVYTILKVEIQGESMHRFTGWHTTILPAWAVLLPYLGLLIPLFSAYRLAKFNVDTRQSYGFLGLPTPANALLFLSIFLIHSADRANFREVDPNREFLLTPAAWTAKVIHDLFALLYHPIVLVALAVLFSILLITEIPLIAMKFKDYTWKGNWPRYVLILISVTLLATLWFRAIPLIIVLYFILSFIDTQLYKKA